VTDNKKTEQGARNTGGADQGHRRERTTATGLEALNSILMPDEKLLCVAEVSMGIFWKCAVMLVFSLVMLVVATPLGVFFSLVTLIMFIVAYLTKYFLLLAATDKRVIIRCGIINLDTIQFRYTKLESVELARTIIGQILGYASVVITGTGSRVTVIPFIANASKFRETLNNILFAQDEKA
jgi:uncharacterized membrane protein YdbT with pleckstrin-like domain